VLASFLKIQERCLDHFFSVFRLDGLQRGLSLQDGKFLAGPVAVMLAQHFGYVRLDFG